MYRPIRALNRSVGISLLPSLPLFALIAVSCVGLMGSAEAEFGIDEIYSIQRESISSIYSADITTRETNRFYLPSGELDVSPSGSMPREERFRLQGDLYRLDLTVTRTKMLTPTGRSSKKLFRLKYIYAYDGEHYQRFDWEYRALRVSRNQFAPYSTDPTFIEPFRFAFQKTKENALDRLRDPQTWERLASHSVFKGFQTVDSVRSAVVDVVDPSRTIGTGDFAGQTVWFRVYFAEDLDFYPVRLECFQGLDEPYHRFTAKYDSVLLETPTGSVRIMKSSETTVYEPDGTVRWVSDRVNDLDTLLVNEVLPLEEFTVPLSVVGRFYDLTTRESWNISEILGGIRRY